MNSCEKGQCISGFILSSSVHLVSATPRMSAFVSFISCLRLSYLPVLNKVLLFHVSSLSIFLLVFSCLLSDTHLPLNGSTKLPISWKEHASSVIMRRHFQRGTITNSLSHQPLLVMGFILGRISDLSKVTGHFLTFIEECPDESHHLAVAP